VCVEPLSVQLLVGKTVLDSTSASVNLHDRTFQGGQASATGGAEIVPGPEPANWNWSRSEAALKDWQRSVRDNRGCDRYRPSAGVNSGSAGGATVPAVCSCSSRSPPRAYRSYLDRLG
jgi:hypothetical protein